MLRIAVPHGDDHCARHGHLYHLGPLGSDQGTAGLRSRRVGEWLVSGAGDLVATAIGYPQDLTGELTVKRFFHPLPGLFHTPAMTKKAIDLPSWLPRHPDHYAGDHHHDEGNNGKRPHGFSLFGVPGGAEPSSSCLDVGSP